MASSCGAQHRARPTAPRWLLTEHRDTQRGLLRWLILNYNPVHRAQ